MTSHLVVSRPLLVSRPIVYSRPLLVSRPIVYSRPLSVSRPIIFALLLGIAAWATWAPTAFAGAPVGAARREKRDTQREIPAEACGVSGAPGKISALAADSEEIARRCASAPLDGIKRNADPLSTVGILAIQDEYRRYAEEASLNGEEVLSLKEYARRKKKGPIAGGAPSTAAPGTSAASGTNAALAPAAAEPARSGFEEIRKASAEAMSRCMSERRDPDYCRRKVNALVSKMKADAGGNFAITNGAKSGEK